MWKEFALINSFTLECSFCGPSRGEFSQSHFTYAHLIEMGRNFCLTLIDYTGSVKIKELAMKELEVLHPKTDANQGTVSCHDHTTESLSEILNPTSS
jgi:hypothetical protein